MKKFFSLLAVLALICMAGTAFAITPSAIGTAKKAYVTFTAPGIDFQVKLYDWVSGADFATGYTGAEATSISFSTDTVVLGTKEASWAKAKTFAKISSNLTALPAGTKVFMYTDNTKADYTGPYKALATRSESWGSYNVALYGGLVKKGVTSTYKAGDLQLLHVLCKKVGTGAGTAGIYQNSLPDISSLSVYGDGRRRLVDIHDTIGTETFDHVTDTGTYTSWKEWIIGTSGLDGGIWVGYGHENSDPDTNWFAGETDVIVFFAGEFRSAIGGGEYGTENITFATITE